MNEVNKHVFEWKIKWRQESGKGVRLNHVLEEKLTSNPEVESRLFFEKEW